VPSAILKMLPPIELPMLKMNCMTPLAVTFMRGSIAKNLECPEKMFETSFLASVMILGKFPVKLEWNRRRCRLWNTVTLTCLRIIVR